MDVKQKVKSLVQQEVEAYFKKFIPEQRKISIVILLGYHSLYPSNILKAVTRLLESYDVTLLLTKDWLPLSANLSNQSYVLLEDTSYRELNNFVEKSALLVVPVASYQLVSKLALSIDDDLAAWLSIQYQLIGKPIVIVNDDVEPNVYQQIYAPYSVLERLNSYISQIQLDQVKWVPLSKLATTVDEQYKSYSEKQSLILAKHIEKAHRDRIQELVVSKRSQITPVARDLARELKIQIIKSDSSKGG
ncbi:hypothetical protein [Neobacillus sp. PS3-40]|uniref:hypothetical protein n=1 Tax=Neobacillus sp. PS3-40 TaxID=3070679 RepID=UPI0027E1E1B7|nr:hypothetical protein [Neobacillus sp. PS3-40]WML44290.1 hypothetical protein RCG20_21400 [Neobacillus sp. PS3-40]